MTNALMIVGADTGVGKTTLCELLLADAAPAARVGIYKPVCTGCEVDSQGHASWSDIERLHTASGGQFQRDLICPQRFDAPLAPPVAAQLEGRCVNEPMLFAGLDVWRSHVDTLIIEGVGGLLCPISDTLTIADLASRWNVPIVIVSASRLGTINHTLLTLEVAEGRGLTVVGWIMNHLDAAGRDAAPANIAEIARRTNVPFLGEIAYAASGQLHGEYASSRMINGREGVSLSGIVALSRPI
jgi:dethiobiotin synthetase